MTEQNAAIAAGGSHPNCRLEQTGPIMQTTAPAPSPASTTSPAALSRDPRARELCRTMAAIHRRGWCDGTGGNFSVVLERSPGLTLLMAPSGVDKGSVRPSQLILVSEAGEVIGGDGRVSAEMPLHRAIVIATGAGAVLHTHSQSATLLSRQTLAVAAGPACEALEGAAPGPAAAGHLCIEGLEMLKGLEGIHTHDCQIRIPVLANDQDLIRLSDAAQPHLKAAPQGLLIAGHGLYAWGKDLEQARRHLEILEFLLEQTWRQQLLEAIGRGLA